MVVVVRGEGRSGVVCAVIAGIICTSFVVGVWKRKRVSLNLQHIPVYVETAGD